MSQIPVALDYAKPLPWRRRRWFRRAAISAALVIVAAIGGHWTVRHWSQLRLLY